ncbi:MAG: hypothetical protein LHW48_02640 [Candidatus Cloacimonetes bacterium]|nr:hypothetical protein [Candidatus Cloacimonadota bacterium]
MAVKTDVSGVVVNTNVLAKLFGVTSRYVNQLAKEGVLEKRAPGRWPLEQNVNRYIEFLRSGKKDPEEQESKSIYWEEKAKHEAAKREMAELQLAKLKNQMHDATTIELVMTDMLTTFKNRLLALPQKVSPKIIGLKSIAEVNEALALEINEALTELSDYSPCLFAEGGEDNGDDESDDGSVLEDSESGSTAT